MDLFDSINPAPDGDWKPSVNPTPDAEDWTEPEPDEPWQPTDAELEAQFCGSERAGIPAVSKTGLAVRARWRAYLEAQPADVREWLESIEDQSYRAAKRRQVAYAAIDSEKQEDF